jgi:hypothetical protein
VRKALVGPALALLLAVASPAALRVSLVGGYAAALQWRSAQDFGISAAAEFDLASFLAVGARFTYASVPIPAPSDTSAVLSQGRLTLMPAVLFLQFRWPGGGKIKPYLAVGGGYSFNSHAMAAAAADDWAAVGFRVEESVDSTTAVYAAAGLDYAVGSRLDFTVHAQIVVSPLAGTWSLTDAATGFKSSGGLSGGNGLNSVVAGIGLKYQF